MLFFKKPAVVNDLDTPGTVIGKGVYIEAARMHGTESVRIDGMFKGNVEINGSLVLGDSGSISGDVHATYFLVAGEVTGNIACDTQLHFASGSKVFGDVQAASLIVDEGAHVKGRYLVTGEKSKPPALASQDTPKFIGDYENDDE